MPANKKSAPKAPAKPANKNQPKPAAKKQPIKAAKAAPAPKSKVAAKPDKKGAAKPASPKTSSVKKTPAKAASKTPSPAKKPAAPAKAAPAPKKAAAPAAKKAAAVPAAKKEKDKAKEAPKPAAKAAKTAPAPAPAPAPVKETAKKGTPPSRSETASAPAGAPAKAAKAAPAPKSGIAKPASVNGGQKITTVRRSGRIEDEGITLEAPKKPVLPAAFLKRQRQRLIELRDAYLSSAEGVANDQLRNANEGGDASAFGMHQADAGSDAYDRDFALSLLAKEQDAIYEINEALKRVDLGTYGLCEMSGNLIPEERLEALPFTRFTVQCQERIEREQMGGRWNRPVRSLFGLDESAEDSEEERDEEETTTSSNSESLDFSKE